MTVTLGSEISAKVIQRITAPVAVNSVLAAITSGGIQPILSAEQVRGQNVAAELAGRADTVKYPAVNVYCEKIVNSLEEKFRRFSGTVQMAVEVRHSQDRLDGIQDVLEGYVDAVMQVLNTNRGDWGDGMFYAGEYQVAVGAVKQGGKNFLQTAKITFEIGVSRS